MDKPSFSLRLRPKRFHAPVGSYCALVCSVIWLQGSSFALAQTASTNAAPVPDTTATATATNAEAPAGLSSPTPAATLNTDAVPDDNSPPTFEKAAELSRQDKQAEALVVLNKVLQADPRNRNALILRGAVYGRMESWDLAEKDYQTALQMDPTNDGVRYDLADLKFKQKQFDDARAAFVPLQDNKDADLRDLIKYKIFICDLLAGHDDVAAKELDAFNKVGSNPSYYFGNAAWDLVHKKTDEAKGWLLSATQIYPVRKHLLYATILKQMGYLPLP